jgi:hypothetical protein
MGTPVTARNLTFDCAEVARDLANFGVGFGKITVNANMEDAIAAGSGTLVTIGSIDGILTTAHVLEALPNRGEVAFRIGWRCHRNKRSTCRWRKG